MKIFLAGTGTMKNSPETLKKCKYFLESFISIKPWQMEYFQNADDFLLDSGAFTFMNGGKAKNLSEYVNRYARFVNEYSIKKFFELDVELVVGWEEYQRLNAKLTSLTHRPPIPVFHKNRGLDWFKNAIREYGYIAYGGIACDRKSMRQFEFDVIPYFINLAHEQNCKIHGLGFTSTSMYDKIRFDTVDSTTWSMGGRMGNLCYFTGTQMRQYYPSKTGKKPKDTNALNIFNFEQWCKYQKYMEDK